MLVTLDFETYYGPKYSLSLQTMNLFKYVADEQFMIHGVGVKIDDQPTTYYDFRSDEQTLQFRALLTELQTEKVQLLAQNTAFDAFILHYYFDWHAGYYADTMAMSRGLFPGRPADLKSLATRLWPGNMALRKGEDLKLTYGVRELSDDISKKLAAYCVQDVELTYAAFKMLEPHYPDAELDLIDWTIRALVQPVLHVNRDLVQLEISEQEAYRKQAIASCGVSESVLKSDKQFCALLVKAGVQIETKRNAKDTADIPALGQKDWPYLKMIARHPELGPVWKARKVAKSNIQESRARWFDAVAEWNGGMMPVPINYYGAETGRWSGGEKLNLQNLPRIDPDDPATGRLRKALVAPPGEVVIVRDLNNIEGRMLAWLAEEEYLLELFRNDGCPYLYMAESIYGAPHGSFTKQTHKGERNVGKVAVLGLGYGMSANKFWVTVNTGPMGMDPIPMSFEQCQSIVNIYRMTNLNIARYWDACNGAISWMASLQPGEERQFGPLTLMRDMAVMPNGMALQYPGLHGEPNAFGGHDFFFGANGTRKIYGAHATENFCQALSRVLLGEQKLTVQHDLDNNYGRDVARIVHSVHDELLVVAPERYADDIYAMMGDVMSATPPWATGLPLKSEGGYALEYSK